MKVLIACEFSGIVRDAFIRRGHDACSCDLLNTDRSGPHIRDNVLKYLKEGWDLMIAHPPCTYLCSLAARWLYDKRHPDRRQYQREAIKFFMALMNAPIRRIAIENPVGIMSLEFRKPNQIIHPWQFGHPTKKRTCLWLKNLPELEPTNIVEIAPEVIANYNKGNRNFLPSQSNRPDTWALRSETFQGFADAMADQWGSITDDENFGIWKYGRKS